MDRVRAGPVRAILAPLREVPDGRGWAGLPRGRARSPAEGRRPPGPDKGSEAGRLAAWRPGPADSRYGAAPPAASFIWTPPVPLPPTAGRRSGRDSRLQENGVWSVAPRMVFFYENSREIFKNPPGEKGIFWAKCRARGGGGSPRRGRRAAAAPASR